MSAADITMLAYPSMRQRINIDATPCAEQIDTLRVALAGTKQYYVSADAVSGRPTAPRQLVRIDTSSTRPQIVPIEHARLTEIAARLYDWIRPMKGGLRQVVPPTPVVRAVLADPGAEIPRLQRIVDVPYLAPSGRVVDRAGYDHETETYLHLANEIAPLPERPSEEQLADAVQLVARDALAGFAFADAASRTNTIASVITYYLRALHPELLTPINLIDAPNNNYGKTTLAQSLVAPLLGHSPDVTQMSTTDRVECRRTIYSLLRDRSTAIILDNLASPLAGDAISSVLTSRRTRDRQIRSSTAPSVENTALWYVTGTLMTTSRELGIRSVLTQLVAPPTGGRDPIQWALDYRIEIVRAYLIIMRRWIADGRRVDTTVKHPKYPRWAEIAGGVLQMMGMQGFLGNQHVLAARDDETLAWEDLIERWAALSGGPAQRRRVGEIVDHAAIAGEPAWDLVSEGRDHDARKKLLGHALRRRDGVVIGAWRIYAAPNRHAKVHEYWLDPVVPATTAPSAPTSPLTPTGTTATAAPKDAGNPAGLSSRNDEGNQPECGVCGVLGPAPNPDPRDPRARVDERDLRSRNPANPALGDWAAVAVEAVATDPSSPLARLVRTIRGGGS